MKLFPIISSSLYPTISIPFLFIKDIVKSLLIATSITPAISRYVCALTFSLYNASSALLRSSISCFSCLLDSLSYLVRSWTLNSKLSRASFNSSWAFFCCVISAATASTDFTLPCSSNSGIFLDS